MAVPDGGHPPLGNPPTDFDWRAIQMLDTILLTAILVVMLGILTALKNGLNQVIQGLESIDGRLSTTPQAA